MIAMVDCNSFYVSCEYAFRPDIRHLPGIVLSNNDGCAIARNDAAKALGIPMGAPFFKIRELCLEHNVQFFSANFSLYIDMSFRVMQTLKQFSPRVEYYSIDECWLDLTGFETEDLRSYGKLIKETVMKWTGIPVSVGISSTKVLAKLANHIAKKGEGVCLLDNREDLNRELADFDASRIWGIGHAWKAKLFHLGIKTAKDFRDFENDHLIQKIFTKVGRQIQDELRGISCLPVSLEREKKKNIMQSRTFGKPVYSKEVFKEAIAHHIHLAAERMRAQGSLCQEVQVFARTNYFKNIDQYRAYRSKRLEVATGCTLKLTEVAYEIIDEIFKHGYEYQKSGIQLTNLVDRKELQVSLFQSGDSKRDNNLMKVMDRINSLEGSMKIKSMACSTSDRSWRMNQNYLSPRYTTSWYQLPSC